MQSGSQSCLKTSEEFGAVLGSNLAKLFALGIKQVKIKMGMQQFQRLLSRTTLATWYETPPAP